MPPLSATARGDTVAAPGYCSAMWRRVGWLATAAVLAAGCSAGAQAGSAAPLAAAPPPASSPAHDGTHAAVPAAAPLRAGGRVTPPTPSRPDAPSPPAGASDEYRCFVVDPGLRQRTFLTGSQFIPANAAIVHHAIFYRVAAADVAEARDLDRADPGDGWTCFGGTGIGGSEPARRLAGGSDWVAAWAPGGGERR